MQVFDPATGHWTSLAPMPNAQGGIAAAALDRGLISDAQFERMTDQEVLSLLFDTDEERPVLLVADPGVVGQKEGVAGHQFGRRRDGRR